MQHSNSLKSILLQLPGLVIIALLLTTAPSYASSTISVENPWIAEAPPMMKMMAGYVTIHNSGDKPVEIIKVASADFSKIEMHRTVIKDGMASMLAVKAIKVPAHGKFVFSPGHYHLMMFNPVKYFKAGDSSELTFTLTNGQSETFKFPVKKATDVDSHEHH